MTHSAYKDYKVDYHTEKKVKLTGDKYTDTKSNETIIKDGVKLIGAGELPSSVPYDASSLYAKNLTSLITPFIKDGVIKLDKEDELISGCLLSDEGVVLQNKVFEN